MSPAECLGRCGIDAPRCATPSFIESNRRGIKVWRNYVPNRKSQPPNRRRTPNIQNNTPRNRSDRGRWRAGADYRTTDRTRSLYAGEVRDRGCRHAPDRDGQWQARRRDFASVYARAEPQHVSARNADPLNLHGGALSRQQSRDSRFAHLKIQSRWPFGERAPQAPRQGDPSRAPARGRTDAK